MPRATGNLASSWGPGRAVVEWDWGEGEAGLSPEPYWFRQPAGVLFLAAEMNFCKNNTVQRT